MHLQLYLVFHLGILALQLIAVWIARNVLEESQKVRAAHESLEKIEKKLETFLKEISKCFPLVTLCKVKIMSLYGFCFCLCHHINIHYPNSQQCVCARIPFNTAQVSVLSL